MKLFLTLNFCMLLLKVAYPQDNGCDIALKVKNSISSNVSFSSNQQIISWLKSQSFKEFNASSAAGLGVTLPIGDILVPFNANTSDADYQKLYNALDKHGESILTNDFKKNFYKNVLAPDAYDKWIECIRIVYSAKEKREENIRSEKSKSYLSGTIEDETETGFILKLSFKPVAGVNYAQIGTITVNGASYDREILRPGVKIGADDISISFTKKLGDIVTIAINTVGNIGSFSKTILPNISVFTFRLFKEFVYRENTKTTLNCEVTLKVRNKDKQIVDALINGSLNLDFGRYFYKNGDNESSGGSGGLADIRDKDEMEQDLQDLKDISGKTINYIIQSGKFKLIHSVSGKPSVAVDFYPNIKRIIRDSKTHSNESSRVNFYACYMNISEITDDEILGHFHIWEKRHGFGIFSEPIKLCKLPQK